MIRGISTRRSMKSHPVFDLFQISEVRDIPGYAGYEFLEAGKICPCALMGWL